MKQVLKTVPVEELNFYRENPRIGNVDEIRRSIRVNGQFRPLVVRKSTMEVLGGNHTLKAMLAEGYTEAQVVLIDVDEREAKRIVLADNKTSDNSTYDDGVLLSLLEGMDDLEGSGWSEKELEKIQKAFAQEEDAPVVTLPNQWRIVIECKSEQEQVELLDELLERGLSATALIA